MPNSVEAVIAMLSCSRVGAIHSVVFGGFAAEQLAQRIQHCEAKVRKPQNLFVRAYFY